MYPVETPGDTIPQAGVQGFGSSLLVHLRRLRAFEQPDSPFYPATTATRSARRRAGHHQTAAVLRSDPAERHQTMAKERRRAEEEEKAAQPTKEGYNGTELGDEPRASNTPGHLRILRNYAWLA